LLYNKNFGFRKMKTNNPISSKLKVLLPCLQSTIVIVILLCSISNINAQTAFSNETVGVLQDRGANFNLKGALTLFEQAKSVRQFEKMINNQNNTVNNLDLNNDGNTDYIIVNDKKDDHGHTLVLSTALSADKSQDIATIKITKLGDNIANVQIKGDTALYPSNVFSESVDDNGGITTADNNQVDLGTSSKDQYNQTTINVWGWPIVQYMYSPIYSVYTSPYYWNYQPHWYRPWRPIAYHTFYSRYQRYRPYLPNVRTLTLNYSRNNYVTRQSHPG
jgi:hypothetical protein